MAEQNVLEELLNDLDKSRSVEVKFYGKEYTFQYKILGSEFEKIQEKYFDMDNMNKTILKTQRKLTWAMLAKANPSDFDSKAYDKFPTELLDLISKNIEDQEGMKMEDFRDEPETENGEIHS